MSVEKLGNETHTFTNAPNATITIEKNVVLANANDTNPYLDALYGIQIARVSNDENGQEVLEYVSQVVYSNSDVKATLNGEVIEGSKITISCSFAMGGFISVQLLGNLKVSPGAAAGSNVSAYSFVSVLYLYNSIVYVFIIGNICML